MNILNNELYDFQSKVELITKCEQIKSSDKEQTSKIDNNTIINDKQQDSIELILSKLAIMENKLTDITKPNQSVVSNSELELNYSNTNQDYIFNNNTISASNTVSIIANSVEFNNTTTSSDDVRLSIKAKDVVMNKLSINNNVYSQDKSNTIISVNEGKYIQIKDCLISPKTAYNGLEIGLSGTQLPKIINIDNCHFSGDFKNNAILVFGTENDAVINITNCTFDSVSNMLRISNRTNSNGIVINIKDCIINKWDDRTQYQGAIIFEDYTSKKENADTNNLFGDNKITVNITNLMIPDDNGSTIKLNNIMDISKRLGSNDKNQIAYVYQDFGSGLIPFDANKYPTFNII